MFGSKKNKQPSMSASNQPVDTLISPNCTIDGDVKTQNSIKIDGQVNGNVEATGQVVVGEKGVVKGDVRCADLLVYGRLEGNVYVDRVQLKPSAVILGNIETETLEVDSGARYQGNVVMKENAPATSGVAEVVKPKSKAAAA